MLWHVSSSLRHRVLKSSYCMPQITSTWESSAIDVKHSSTFWSCVSLIWNLILPWKCSVCHRQVWRSIMWPRIADRAWNTSHPTNIGCKTRRSKAETSTSESHRKANRPTWAQQDRRAAVKERRAKRAVIQIATVHSISWHLRGRTREANSKV